MVKEAMRSYFAKLLQRWEALGSLPQASLEDSVDPAFYLGMVDDDPDLMLWRPLEKRESTPFDQLEAEIGQAIHPSIKEYFNSFWFCALGGRYEEIGVDLVPVLPGVELKAFQASLLDYREAHGGTADHVPLGTEENGLLVVVSNQDGQVMLEDYEGASLETVAPSLADFIRDLRV